jgi:hypothetical protein
MPYKNKIKQKEAQRQHYLVNKERYKESSKRNRNDRDVWFANIKSQQECGHCGMQDYRCLDFHHRDVNSKEFGITYAVKAGYAEDRIIKEIAKCDVLCANCHTKEHHNEKQIWCRQNITNNVSWLRDFKKKLKCCDCGINDYIVLAFHHISEKISTISKMVYGGCSVSKLLDEIAKCEILCCNCHRIRHNGNIWSEDSKERFMSGTLQSLF